MEIARSSRLILRRVAASDLADIVTMHELGKSVDRWSPPMKAGTTFEQMFDRWLTDDPLRHCRLVSERIANDAGPRLANIVAFTDVVRGVFQNAFIGWRTHPALLRQGYCTEAVAMALRHAFAANGLGLHRVQAAILPDNRASCLVAERCGFRHEGVAKRYLHIRGEWRDHAIYAITAEDLPSVG